MLWFLLWVGLFVAAAGVFAYLGRHLWRKAKALTAELSAASERLGQIAAEMTESIPPAPIRSSDRP